MEYHNISRSPRKSIFAWLEEHGRIRHLVDSTMIKKMISNAPNTRARSRGEFIKRCLKDPSLHRKVQSINWEKAETDTKTIYFGSPNNPFVPYTFSEPRRFGDVNAHRYRFPGM